MSNPKYCARCTYLFSPTSIVESCDEWYELMVGQLLFTSPLVLSTDYDVVATAEVSLLHRGGRGGQLVLIRISGSLEMSGCV